MNARYQRTITREGQITGTGLHTGESGVLRLKPASLDSGIRFFRQGRQIGPATSEESMRCSQLGEGKDRLLTVEHFLASVLGLGITNLDIEVEGPEVPGLDGSALSIVQRLKELGLRDQGLPADVYRIQEPIFCYDKAKAIAVIPASVFSVTYVLDYEHPFLRAQKVDFTLTPEFFESQIAPARTFCTDQEALELQKSGLGLGATRQNTVVVAQDGSHVPGLRFVDECARHKILDILGDIQLLGSPILGHVMGIRSGHALNRQLVRQIRKQREDHGR